MLVQASLEAVGLELDCGRREVGAGWNLGQLGRRRSRAPERPQLLVGLVIFPDHTERNPGVERHLPETTKTRHAESVWRHRVAGSWIVGRSERGDAILLLNTRTKVDFALFVLLPCDRHGWN